MFEQPAEPPGGHARAGAEKERARRLGAELQAACLRRLVRDWESLNWCHLGGRLRPPAFRLDPVLSRWGQWEPQGRTIALAERLVLEHDWPAVLEVLRHEMAHQVVDELFGLAGAPAHGEAFRRACALLGVEPRAAGDPLAVLRRQPDGEPAPEQARLRRVRRLLALADSPNPHEAEAALAKAHELLLRYNLELLELRGGAEQCYCVRHLGQPQPRRSRADKLAAGILTRHFFVEAIWIDSFCPRTGREGRVLEIAGSPHNVELAEYTWHELHRAAAELWEKHWRQAGIYPRARAAQRYIEGVLTGFDERLERERSRQAAERALVWRGDPALQAFFRRRHPRVRTESVAAGEGALFEAGRHAGQALRLRRAVRGGGSAARGRLLEHRGG
ncbi:MAG: hypothetical protein KatS3mg102_1524 [Planctomycetota bacterium]|nr:MAG: hypothetical protein KatS3mg102_1524 [Planctomycetota bacterium]